MMNGVLAIWQTSSFQKQVSLPEQGVGVKPRYRGRWGRSVNRCRENAAALRSVPMESNLCVDDRR
ncbi:hypothetical protein C0Q70_21331 [Pomacea canaliculata]|uniref:Uncharacterized protein n=1 Tax=Pomacea canaliculata TaxID=400727 RepID=A0A2T7NC86_POMCA|nr:hypothetical protein C0Q70_21331 [Pomacea canaliculata]